MLFNSYVFVLFFVLVFFLYWFLFNKNVIARNLFLIAASYLFYGWWDWRFLFLIIISSVGDFLLGNAIFSSKDSHSRKLWLIVSLCLNLGILGYFKYAGFFIKSFSHFFTPNEFELHNTFWKIILPVGISFYTFQSLGYIFDIYYKKIKPADSILSYLAFVSFFPQLVAGPIERASHLLPQFSKRTVFDYESSKDGLRQILWGLFKKIVVADSCAVPVMYIFQHHTELPASTHVLGIVLFAFQIYGDFSGYSDMAQGIAKLLGFSLIRNFSNPYFSRSMEEFWRRWHISLSTWFRDYVYIPLGGNRHGKTRQCVAVLITFTVSGFWHGAGMNYLAWGLFNGILFLPSVLLSLGKNEEFIVERFSIQNLGKILLTFSLICLGWVFFRAVGLKDALFYFREMFSGKMIQNPFSILFPAKVSLIVIAILIITEGITRKRMHGLDILNLPVMARWMIYLFVLTCILFAYNPNDTFDFIYFQF